MNEFVMDPARNLHVPWPVGITDEDVQNAEETARRAAAEYRSQGDLDAATMCEGVADRINRELRARRSRP